MENVGALAVLLAFCISIYAIVSSVVGRVKRRPFLVISGERSVYAVWLLITTAAGILVYNFLISNFSFAYVASHSNRDMQGLYKLAALWGGQEGSLLFWSFLLSTYAAVVVFSNRRRHRDIMPYVVAIISAVQTFFLTLNAFVVSPFQMLAVDRVITSVPDGMGLNPTLQYPAMAIHPPMLYLGYVGMTIPFAFAMASMLVRQPGEAWINTTRRWSLVTWLFQSCGIVLGAGWAYHALGWGGYWAWDPVENASFLPWLSSTAFLHSVMMQEKKGMMKIWNIVLVSSSFFLCIFGTFLTRSGVVSSVHAFAQSPIGKYFVGFLSIGIALTIYAILDRLSFLKSESDLESVVSRESSFLFNNLVLLASCFAVLWGTLFPVISEAFTNEKISLDKPWFDHLMIPIGLFLLFLTGVGPLFAWRRTSIDSLRRNFTVPGLLGLATSLALWATGIRHPYALISFGLCAFVTSTIFMEFFRGARAIAQKQQMNFAMAVVELTHRNTRRYGGYLVHMGIVLVFIGITGAAFDHNATFEVKKGEEMKIGNYDLKVVDFQQTDNPVYQAAGAIIDVYKGGDKVTTLEPERRFYKASQQPLAEVGLRRALNEDVYINFASFDQATNKATIQAYVFPLVDWIWIGTLVLVFGTLVALVPSKVARQYPRTQVVGIKARNVPVEK
jgi:cytochrome c-type biogenesis protein CcmF